MDIPLDVEVSCSDGRNGRSTAIIVDPKSDQVTHFVVEAETREYLVPINAIAESAANRIRLHWSWTELIAAEPFVKQVPADEAHMEILAAEMAGSSVLGPYTSPDAVYMAETLAAATMGEEQVPENELAIHWGARVEATDGDIGRVDELLIDPQTNRISHLVLRKGHFWGKRDVTIPVEQIDRVEADVLFLRLDKAAVGQLPSVPAPKK
jgi:sporulation protein YlmC with PRC-barrel domain